VTDARPHNVKRRLRGGLVGPLWALVFVASAGLLLYGLYIYPEQARSYGFEIPYQRAMFGVTLFQPIAFSHRLHVTDKEIDCFYCHPYGERSMNAGLPSAAKCLGCHDYIIPGHEEIQKLKGYKERGESVPWVRVYYNPDHVYFPHFMHLKEDLRCQECHGEVETVDTLHQVTFYMGFCVDCHHQKKAPVECSVCHQ
jgi:hypothetical protein